MLGLTCNHAQLTAYGNGGTEHAYRLEIRSDIRTSLQLGKTNRLVGLKVKASASRAEDPGFKPRLRRDFSGVESHQ